ncbi:glycosyltransferase family 2 protein [Paraburkholderia sp. CNPSo 3157]|uniref:Glycosyltransferase family 2 protein n=1 Tax=Paraburkholderia franconis TaxID=2654983 RepID=A0A7X1TIL7_9BURK|nr:glycosyltransferase family 2 protein [Paraburkholderia franconis]MPW20610.1 glycosyltransferase family 2 protein [Paraburkholderia franconis]
MSLGDQVAWSGNASTGIVVVFYRPDAACVRRANRYADAGLCVVIDNTEQLQSAGQLGLDKRIVYVANGANHGIATGINQGVELLLKAGCTSALIFDQDSEPSGQLLQALPRLLEEEKQLRGRVALIGPAYEDTRLGGVAPFVRFGYLKLQRVAPVGTRPIEIDFLISSGSCINLAAWQEIGPMDDSLFIDFVDLEWCVRARSRGYAVLGAPGLRLAHELGGEPVSFLGRQYPSHSPLRHYYLFRNAVALVKRSYIPWTWKSTELVKFPFRLAIYGLFLQPRLSHLRMAFVGIWHGLTGRMGPLDRL